MKEDNSKKIILDLCGGTGSWSKPYKEAGYDVRIITLPLFDITDPYVIEQCIALKPYGILAAPPCTKFSRAAWQIPRAERDFKEGIRCVSACMDIIWGVQEEGAPLAFWALENPNGYLYRFMGYPKFYFQPWQFGETDFRAMKRTAIWGYFNIPTNKVRKRDYTLLPKVSQHSRHDGYGSVDPARVNRKWSNSSAEDRAKTSEFFAKAFLKANP